MNIIITGGTGFIGSKLCKLLLREGHFLKIITRNPEKHGNEQSKNQEFISWNDDLAGAMHWADGVINLAGETIFGKRWNEEVKQRIHSSRIENTTRLVKAIQAADQQPSVMISGSAVGYYAENGSKVLDENNQPGDDFLAKVCADWEHAAKPVEACGVRLIISRTGIVLQKNGGMLQQMLPAFRLFAGGPIGRGSQYVPWIHIHDLCRAYSYLLNDETASGIFNICAPDAVTMDYFAQVLGDAMNRPARLRVPEWVLKAALGEAAKPALDSIRAYPTHLLDAGFDFKYNYLREALADIL